jgi:ADP-ribosylglycohydrolase
MFLSMALNGTNQSKRSWIERSTKLTHRSPQTVECCHRLAKLCILAAQESENFVALAAAKYLAESKSFSPLIERLQKFPEYLEQQLTPNQVATQMGWASSVPNTALAVTTMGVYCFLRYPGQFQQAVQSAVGLAGATSSLGAVVGGLCGAHLGRTQIPQPLIGRLSNFAYGPSWMEQLAKRIAEWPHGADDLHVSPTLPSAPISLLLLHGARWAIYLARSAFGLLYRIISSPFANTANS